MNQDVIDAMGIVTSNQEAAEKVCNLVLAAKGLIAVPKGQSGPGGSLGPFVDHGTPAPPPKPAWAPPFVPAWMDTISYVFAKPPEVEKSNPSYATLETANAIAASIPGATVEPIYQQIPLVLQPQYELIGHSPDGKPNGKKLNAGEQAGKFSKAKIETDWLGVVSETKASLGLIS